jgi:hypothetical protein
LLGLIFVTQRRKDAKGYKPEVLAGFDFVSRKDAKGYKPEMLAGFDFVSRKDAKGYKPERLAGFDFCHAKTQRRKGKKNSVFARYSITPASPSGLYSFASSRLCEIFNNSRSPSGLHVFASLRDIQ